VKEMNFLNSSYLPSSKLST